MDDRAHLRLVGDQQPRLQGERLSDCEYWAHLVELDEEGNFDTYLGLCVEDVFWFYEQEFVPAET